MKRVALMSLLAASLAPATARPLTAQEPAVHFVIRECGRLGIAFTSDAERLIVAELMPGSPAAAAGLQPNDTILTFNGERLTPAELRRVSASLRPGDVVRLRVRRGGVEHAVSVTAMSDLCVRYESTATADEAARIAASAAQARAAAYRVQERYRALQRQIEDQLGETIRERAAHMARLQLQRIDADSLRVLIRRGWSALDSVQAWGLAFDRVPTTGVVTPTIEIGRRAVAGAEFTELGPELAYYFKGAEEGLLVLGVAPGTPAARAGLVPGDVVVRIDDRPVRTVSELRAAFARARDAALELEIVRRGETHTITIPPGR